MQITLVIPAIVFVQFPTFLLSSNLSSTCVTVNKIKILQNLMIHKLRQWWKYFYNFQLFYLIRVYDRSVSL